jgi:serine/threonine-protein kinase
MVLQIAEAVAAAHQRKIIHRDLKPENLMSVRRDNESERYVVLDFGLSRALDAEPDPITRSGAILGTPQYMSPEAARGNTGTEASDVYALATILYELLAGHPPFFEGTAIEVLAQQATSPPPRFAQTLNIAPALEEFILSNLAKEPNLRCPNSSHFRTGLQHALAQGPLTTFTCLNAPSSSDPAPCASQMKPLVSK